MGIDLTQFVSQFFSALKVGSIPLVIVIYGLVAWFKQLGVKGNNLVYTSMGTGVVFGVGFNLYQTPPPSGSPWLVFQYWFSAVVFGLFCGLVTSGAVWYYKNNPPSSTQNDAPNPAPPTNG